MEQLKFSENPLIFLARILSATVRRGVSADVGVGWVKSSILYNIRMAHFEMYVYGWLAWIGRVPSKGLLRPWMAAPPKKQTGIWLSNHHFFRCYVEDSITYYLFALFQNLRASTDEACQPLYVAGLDRNKRSVALLTSARGALWCPTWWTWDRKSHETRYMKNIHTCSILVTGACESRTNVVKWQSCFQKVALKPSVFKCNL